MLRVLGMIAAGLLAGLGPWAPASRAGGTVSTNTTAALLQALQGGGTVSLAFSDVLVLETQVIIAADTVLLNGATAGRTVSVSGDGRRRLFHVLPGVRLEVRDLILREGWSTNGGAIFNQGTLVASNVTFTACKAEGVDGSDGAAGTVDFGFGKPGAGGGSGTPAAGGAIFNVGSARLEACTFNVNAANGGDGGSGGRGGVGASRVGRGGDGGAAAAGYGGAISSSGTLEVLRCLFTGNAARGGAGGEGGSNSSVLSAGQGASGALAAGGAIHSTGWLLLSASSFTTNIVLGGAAAAAGAPDVNLGLDGNPGGAAWGGAVASWSTGVVVNTTFYTNLVAGGSGGAGAAGTFTVGDGGAGGDALGAALHARGRLAVTNVTFAWNTGTNGVGGAAGAGGSASSGSPGRFSGSAIAADAGAVATVVNSILASTGAPTVLGPVTDLGHNVFTDHGTGATVSGSLYRTDPLLGPYQVWITGTPGCLPLSGSPVVDRSDPTSTPSSDQRGLPRPVGQGPDIGAMEVGALSYFLSGKVLNGEAGVAGMPVFVGTNSVITDASGGFRLGPFPTGFYVVELGENPDGYTPRLLQVSLQADVTGLVFRSRQPFLSLAHDAVPGTDALTGLGMPGTVYRLEVSADLSTWVDLGSATSDSQGRVAFVHRPDVGTSWFYRLVGP